MKCLVTGNSAVNVVLRLQSRLPSSARRDSGALGACSGQAPAVRVSTLSRHNVHAHNTQPQLMAGAGRPGGAEAGNTQHRVALRVPQATRQGNNRAWPFLEAVFYRKYCVQTCQTIRRTWPDLAGIVFIPRQLCEILLKTG